MFLVHDSNSVERDELAIDPADIEGTAQLVSNISMTAWASASPIVRDVTMTFAVFRQPEVGLASSHILDDLSEPTELLATDGKRR